MANNKPGVACRLRNTNQPFTIVDNAMFDDPHISLEAKGLCGIFKRWATFTAPGFECSKTFLMRKSGCAEKRFERIWKELKLAGYIKMYWDGFSWTAELLQIPEPDAPHTYYCSADGTVSRTVGGKNAESSDSIPENEEPPMEMDELPPEAQPAPNLEVVSDEQPQKPAKNGENPAQKATSSEMLENTPLTPRIQNNYGVETSPPQNGGDCPKKVARDENQSPPFEGGLNEGGLKRGGLYIDNQHSFINTSFNNQSIMSSSEQIALSPNTGEIDPMDEIIHKTKKQISYDALYSTYLQYKQRDKINALDTIVRCMADVYACTAPTIHLCRQEMATVSVQNRFRTLDQMHIEYVIFCFNKSRKNVSNIPAYLNTALYNAPTTIEAFYDKMVAADQ